MAIQPFARAFLLFFSFLAIWLTQNGVYPVAINITSLSRMRTVGQQRLPNAAYCAYGQSTAYDYPRDCRKRPFDIFYAILGGRFTIPR